MFESEKREVRITTLRGRSAIADEAAEFELPAIFKSSAQPINERPNLLGRLSEALASSGQQERERSRTVIPFEPAHGRMLEPPPVTIEPVKENLAATVDKIAAENDSAKRNMTSFFDTRMTRMSAMSQPVEEPRKRTRSEAGRRVSTPATTARTFCGGGQQRRGRGRCSTAFAADPEAVADGEHAQNRREGAHERGRRRWPGGRIFASLTRKGGSYRAEGSDG